MAVQIQLRNDTASNWTSADPTLAAGEIGIETDTSKLKLGDGTTAWSSLGYFEPSSLETLSDVVITDATTGEILQFDGTDWVNAAIDALPSQTGNSGTYLTTDGSTASWASVSTDPNPQIFMMMGA